MLKGMISAKDCAAVLILAATLAFSTQANAATVGARPGADNTQTVMENGGALPRVYETDAAGNAIVSTQNAGNGAGQAAGNGAAASEGAAMETNADGTPVEGAAEGETLPEPNRCPRKMRSCPRPSRAEVR